MKIVSFNINGLRARLHQLQALIDTQQPDIIGLQETKVHDEVFPHEAITAMGYHVVFHGQKAHYGVALLSKTAPLQVEKGFVSDEAGAQRRLIIATYARPEGGTLKVINGYFPQGESEHHATKFPAKAKFYADLQAYIAATHHAGEALVVMGDINISPTDLDIGIGEANRKRWLRERKCSFLPIERQWLADLQALGLSDSFRLLHPAEGGHYSWFDYRSKGFDDNRGLRIDVILLSGVLRPQLQGAGIDYALRAIEKPSDHAPVWVALAPAVA
ncbi:MAG: exodeoxyribonuclease III [Aeromonas sp.]